MSETFVDKLPCGCKVSNPFLLKVLNAPKPKIQISNPKAIKSKPTARMHTEPPYPFKKQKIEVITISDSE